MSSLNKHKLKAEVSPPLDAPLVEQLLSEYVSQEKRFFLRDWEPSTLDGGQLTEAAARLLYHQDSGNLNRRKGVGDCLGYVEGQGNPHAFPDRKAAVHLARVLRTVYKFRSDRGAVHIDPEYTANHLDSKLVVENSKWIVAEFLRIFWNGDRAKVATAIREILEFELPIIGSFEDLLLVQRTDCTVEEEILLLLHHAGESGLSQAQLRSFIPKNQSSVSRALAAMGSFGKRQIIRLSNKNYRLTDIGARTVITELAEKLAVA